MKFKTIYTLPTAIDQQSQPPLNPHQQSFHANSQKNQYRIYLEVMRTLRPYDEEVQGRDNDVELIPSLQHRGFLTIRPVQPLEKICDFSWESKRERMKDAIAAYEAQQVEPININVRKNQVQGSVANLYCQQQNQQKVSATNSRRQFVAFQNPELEIRSQFRCKQHIDGFVDIVSASSSQESSLSLY